MSERSSSIDALRGASILMVLGYHYLSEFPIFHYGNYGVLLFFVISGYCIYLSATRSNDAGHFYAKRFGRLLPALIVCAFATYFAKKIAPELTEPERIPSLWHTIYVVFSLPTSNILNLENRHPDGAYWSLAVEFQSYFLVAVALLFKRFVPLLPFVVMCVALGILLAATGNLTKRVEIDFFPAFIAGLAIAAYVAGDRKIAIFALVAALVLDAVVLAADLNQPSIPVRLSRTVALWLSVALVAGAVRIKMPKRLEQGLLPLIFLGVISYPLYLLHQDLGNMAFIALGAAGDGALYDLLVRVLLVPFAIIAAAFLVYSVVERSLIRPTTAALIRLFGLPRLLISSARKPTTGVQDGA